MNLTKVIEMNVLVVDDDEGIRNSLSGFIESERHTCRIAKNGMEALEMLENYQPDLIIVDISMPKMTGIELIRHIRTKYRGKNTRIVLMSGRQPSETELQIIAQTGSEVIKKPINPLIIKEYLR